MNTKKILIADDDSDIIASMFVILNSRGHNVITAGSGKEALEKFTENKPDLVLLDLMMEKFDSGVTVCKKIRETDKDVIIYLISAVGDKAVDIPEAQEIGFNGVISKPVTPENLIKLMDSF